MKASIVKHGSCGYIEAGSDLMRRNRWPIRSRLLVSFKSLTARAAGLLRGCRGLWVRVAAPASAGCWTSGVAKSPAPKDRSDDGRDGWGGRQKGPGALRAQFKRGAGPGLSAAAITNKDTISDTLYSLPPVPCSPTNHPRWR